MKITPIIPEPIPTSYQIELTKDEAEDLQLICQYYLKLQYLSVGSGHHSIALASKIVKELPVNKESRIDIFK